MRFACTGRPSLEEGDAIYSTGETWYEIPDWRRDTRHKRPEGGRMEKWEDKWTRENDRTLEKGE